MIELLRGINFSVFHFFNGFLGVSAALDVLILFFAQYAVFVVGLVVILSLLRDHRLDSGERFRRNATRILLTLGTVVVVTEAIRSLYHHPRPTIIFDIPHLFLVNSFSFPSGHTIFMFGLATAVYYYDRKLSLMLALAGLMVGAARIAAGVHYPFDILGGIFFGILSGIFVESLLRLGPVGKRKRRGGGKGTRA